MFWAVLRLYWPLFWNRVSSWLCTAQLWLNLTQCHSLAFICFFTASWKLHKQGSPLQHVAGCQNLFGEWLPVKVYTPKRKSSRHLSCSFRLTMNLLQLANTWRDMPGRRGRIKRRAENSLGLTQPFTHRTCLIFRPAPIHSSFLVRSTFQLNSRTPLCPPD